MLTHTDEMAAISHMNGDAERRSSVDRLKLNEHEFMRKGMEERVTDNKESMEQLKEQMKLSEKAFKIAQEAVGKNDGKPPNLR